MVERHSQYIKNPAKLIDIVDYVVKKLSQKYTSEISQDKILQFHEISKTIERLKIAGANVPDELRRLKIDLYHEVTEHEKIASQRENALVHLQEMELRLANTLTDIRSSISRLANSGSTTKTKSKRYVKRTSPAILAKEIRKAIRELGGSAKKADVLKKVKVNMEGKFKPQDLERDAQGNLNWEKWSVAEKGKMVKEGVLKVGAGFGVWELRRK